jgi:hypothetical protein
MRYVAKIASAVCIGTRDASLRALLAPDIRLEGFTAEDWTRLGRVLSPEGARPSESLGGIFVVHSGGVVRKMLHTRRGRLEREGEWATWPDEAEVERTKRFAALAGAHQASWVVAAEVGALDEVMERFGARAKRGDDIVAQALSIVGIVRELMNEGRVEGWPRRLKNIPVPTAPMVKRAMDSVCTEGHAIALGVFKDGELFTSLVVRRGARGFDMIAGPDELRKAIGLLSGEWRRDVRHVVSAVEDKYAPLALGCFGELGTFHQLQQSASAGAWSRAVAVRDVVLSPMPLAIGVALGIDGARYAFDTIRSLSPAMPLAILEPAIAALRKRAANVTDKDIAAVLGFSPLEILRALRKPERDD